MTDKTDEFIPEPYESYEIDTNVKPKKRKRCHVCGSFSMKDYGFALFSIEGVIRIPLCKKCSQAYLPSVINSVKIVQGTKIGKTYVVRKKQNPGANKTQKKDA